MKIYLCETHGKLDPSERIMLGTHRWCKHCFEAMIDKFAGKLIEVEKDEKES